MSHWNKKVVVVTGGSEGLGQAIVQAFAEAGATVVMLARDPQKLALAIEHMASQGLSVHGIPTDVTDDRSVSDAAERILIDHGSIDAWINNVGKSTRVSAIDCSLEEYERLMQLNFFSAVRCTRAVLPELTRSSGVLVNIGSLASKTAWPLMAPYAASKHALSAYTHQLRLEGPANVHFLHVCPGPIKRADAGRRYDAEAGTTKIPEAARRAGAGAKVSGIEPLNLARRIVSACERRQSELLVPWHSRFLFAIAQLSSTAGDWLLRRFMS